MSESDILGPDRPEWEKSQNTLVRQSTWQKLLSASRLRVRRKSVFFATLLMHIDIVPSNEVALAATDGERIYLNPQAAAQLSNSALDGLLLHEVLHAALEHLPRRGTRQSKPWNQAADIVVNGMVTEAGFGLPESYSTVRNPKLERLAVEEIYQLLAKHEPNQDEQNDTGGTNDTAEGEASYPDELIDLLDQPPQDATNSPNSTTNQTSEALQRHRKWQQALAKAQSIQTMQGKGSHPLDEYRDLLKLQAPQLNWRSLLWRYLVRTPVDFVGFDRRFIGRGLYLEALAGEALQVALAVDTSGSVNDTEISQLIAEVKSILNSYPHIKVDLYYADCQLYGPHQLTSHSEIPQPQGGGGTDFRPFFDRLSAGGNAGPTESAADLAIYLTDGYGDFPEQPPTVTMLWAVSMGGLDNARFPFGEVVRLSDDN